MATISFDNALGIHEKALQLRTQRAGILANNLANADTPGFKARDINFRQLLANEKSANARLNLKTTKSGHIQPGTALAGGAELQYRVPLQPSIDGNTVDEQMESTEFARNALEFAASFRFLNGKFKGLKKAISGD